jgi:hypothetical protein
VARCRAVATSRFAHGSIVARRGSSLAGEAAGCLNSPERWEPFGYTPRWEIGPGPRKPPRL